MRKQEKRLLWSATALTLGLVSMPSLSQGMAVEGERAIDRLPEIRNVLRAALEEGKESNKLPGLGKRLAQDWPNWSNWSNG
jgi:hypothetical protein